MLILKKVKEKNGKKNNFFRHALFNNLKSTNDETKIIIQKVK